MEMYRDDACIVLLNCKCSGDVVFIWRYNVVKVAFLSLTDNVSCKIRNCKIILLKSLKSMKNLALKESLIPILSRS